MFIDPKSNAQKYGRLQGFQAGDNGTGLCLINPCKPGDPVTITEPTGESPVAVPHDQCYLITELWEQEKAAKAAGAAAVEEEVIEEEVVEEVKEPKVGDTVTYNFNGTTHTGEIKELDPAKGLAFHVRRQTDNKLVKRWIKTTDLVAPF
jgi:hypothetical protein